MREIVAMFCSAVLASGCGGGSGAASSLPPSTDPWAAVTNSIVSAQSQFEGGFTLEVMTPEGVVYSRGVGAFSNTTYAPVASASKMVSATVFLRLAEQGLLPLETQTKALLVNRQGKPWSGNMGDIRVRQLLSFTSGISSDVLASEDTTITLDEAVKRIYDDQSPSASTPGSYFYYGGTTHMRIAARMAELATGKTWRQLFDEQLRLPLGWGVSSTYGGAANPNPAGGLACTGLEYTRFLCCSCARAWMAAIACWRRPPSSSNAQTLLAPPQLSNTAPIHSWARPTTTGLAIGWKPPTAKRRAP